MYRESLLITITDNSWLHAGVKALLPDMANIHLRFGDILESDIIRNASKIFVLIDCRIVLNGTWDNYNSLINLRPDSTVIWLSRMETGLLFPQGRQGDRLLAQNLDIASLSETLKRTAKDVKHGKKVATIKNINLTFAESRLLNFFCSNLNIHTISKLTGKSVKTLYIHRQNILLKTGLRHPAFLQLALQRSPWLLGLSSVRQTEERRLN